MFSVKCLYDNIYRKEKAYDIYDFPYRKIISSAGKKYITLPATFDIETSTIYDKQKSILNDKDCYSAFMYHWQMCVNGYVVFGRKWEEWVLFINKLKEILKLSNDRKLVIYVHNLSYEFQFIYPFFDYKDIFATENHKVLTMKNDYFEFRCSYRLSNMSLEKFIENTENTHHNKRKGDLDYSVTRTPKTILNELEMGYCYNDVLGLYECLIEKLKDDTLETIPLTSTGYVRRDCRNAMQKNKKNHKQFVDTQLDLNLYELFKNAFRGGNTACNRYLADMILDEVYSVDLSSSYPYVMIAKEFPCSPFLNLEIADIEELDDYNSKFCTLANYTFENIRLKPDIPVPYISTSKCTGLQKGGNYLECNGRLIQCDMCTLAMTNIDFDILKKQYIWDNIYVTDFHFSRKRKLPQELRDVIYDYFYKKTTLKGEEKHYYEYMKSKNKLNSIFGMCVTDIVHDEIVFDVTEGFKTKEIKDKEAELKDFYNSRNNFLSYQWGIFITAYARQRLQEGIDTVGMDCVYVDTDSVKFLNSRHIKEFEKMNEELIKECTKKSILNSVEINDKIFYMGTWDYEGMYDSFKTLGAKKYAFRKNDKIGLTVSGLDKQKGAQEIERCGGLEAFKNGKVFNDSGRKVAYFNIEPIHEITVNNDTFTTASNIAIVDTTYTLGISDTLLSILEKSKKGDI